MNAPMHTDLDAELQRVVEEEQAFFAEWLRHPPVPTFLIVQVGQHTQVVVSREGLTVRDKTWIRGLKGFVLENVEKR